MPSKQRLKQTADGILLMAFFTFLWGLLAEIALHRRDHWLLGWFFLAIIVVLIVYYIRYTIAEKKLPQLPAGREFPKKENKGFIIIAVGNVVVIAGIVVLYRNIGSIDFITAMVCTGCALATSIYGVTMILRGHKIVYDTSISIH